MLVITCSKILHQPTSLQQIIETLFRIKLRELLLLKVENK
jgi:hypothetical protein